MPHYTPAQRRADPDAAANDMVTRNLGLAGRYATKFLWTGVPLDELRSVTMAALVRASRKFDPGNGAKFSTFAYLLMGQAVHRDLEERQRAGRVPARRFAQTERGGDNLPADARSADPSRDAETAEMLARVEAAVGMLDARHRNVLRWRFRDGLTLDVIGRRLGGISKERVRQIQVKALEACRGMLAEDAA